MSIDIGSWFETMTGTFEQISALLQFLLVSVSSWTQALPRVLEMLPLTYSLVGVGTAGLPSAIAYIPPLCISLALLKIMLPGALGAAS